MKHEDVSIGMKVVPFQKTKILTDSFETSPTMKIMKEYATVAEWIDDENCWLLRPDTGYYGGCCFNACDFEPYVEEKKKDFYPYHIQQGQDGGFVISQTGTSQVYVAITTEGMLEKLRQLIRKDTA